MSFAKVYDAHTTMFFFLIITASVVLNTAQRGFCEEKTFTWNAKLETDCSRPPAQNKVAVIPDVSYPFRTDYLTLQECQAYKEVPCTAAEFDYCEVNEYGETRYRELYPFFKTYFELDCGDSGWRSFLQAYTKKFSIISAKRALTVKIRERNDTKDPVHADVFEPVRDQVIDLTVQAATTMVTSKIYGNGILPSLVALRIFNAKNLSIKRRDFNLIPNVRLIVFRKSTIAEMEPYTFTDLLHLGGLSVDKGLWDAFYAIKTYEDHKSWVPSLASESRRALLWSDADFDKIHRIHCDCSFAWYRNFLKSKPELIEYKQAGAMAVIGSYMSESFHVFSFDSHVHSVDCARNLTKENYEYGDQFSNNVTCFGPC